VFILSILQLLLGGATAGLLWYQIFTNDNLKGDLRIAAFVAAGVYSAVALGSLLGLVGAIIRNRAMVAIYSTVLYVLIAFTTAVGVYFIIQLYRNGDKLKADCEGAVNDVKDSVAGTVNDATPGKIPDVNTNGINEKDICRTVFSQAKWVFIINLVASFFIQLYCAFIVSSYVRQLSDEQSFRSVQRNWADATPGAESYYKHTALPHPHTGQGDSLLHPGGGYAYTDKANAFGHQRSGSNV